MLDTTRVETRLAAARAHADRLGLRKHLEEQLTFLDRFAHPKITRATLFHDHAPFSFSFQIEALGEDGVWQHWFSGGLIFHGPHDGHGSGEAPTLAVSIVPIHGWQIHT